MKKTILSILLLFSAYSFAQTKGEIEIGAFTGLPTGKISEYYSINAGLNLAYTHPVSDNLFIGASVNWNHYFEKSNLPMTGFNVISLSAKGKYKMQSAPVSFNLDLGAGMYGSSKLGLYLFPKIAYTFGKNEVYLGYQYLGSKNRLYKFDESISDYVTTSTNANYGSVNIGYNFIIR